MKNRYAVYLTNFDTTNHFDTYAEAVEYMKHAGFESSMIDRAQAGAPLMAKFSPITGFYAFPECQVGKSDCDVLS